MKIIERVKKFFKKTPPKLFKGQKRNWRTEKSSRMTNKFKDYYCYYIENGKKIYSKVICSYHVREKDDVLRYYHHVKGKEEPRNDVVLLGRKVDELVKLKERCYELTGKNRRQAKALTTLQKEYEHANKFYYERYIKETKEFKQFRENAFSYSELEKLTAQIKQDSLVVSLLSDEKKVRFLAEVIQKHFEEKE